MTMTPDDLRVLKVLDERLRLLLPEDYQDSYEDIQPTAMGSAGLKFDAEGQVAWNEIWGSFCDLAMAGGPPHKGTLLEPGVRGEIEAHPHGYASVVDEICRGVTMVTDLVTREAPIPGWVRVHCLSNEMAGWLLRAITMENVAVRRDGRAIDLPAAPDFRLEKEIKNVVTVIAKTCHYWMGHMPRTQKQEIADLFARMEAESPLVQPAGPEHAASEDVERDALADVIQRDTGLHRSTHQYAGWLGVVCPSVAAAVWMMRALLVSNVLSRREDTVLFVPVDPSRDRQGERVSCALARVHHLAGARGML